VRPSRPKTCWADAAEDCQGSVLVDQGGAEGHGGGRAADSQDDAHDSAGPAGSAGVLIQGCQSVKGWTTGWSFGSDAAAAVAWQGQTKVCSSGRPPLIVASAGRAVRLTRGTRPRWAGDEARATVWSEMRHSTDKAARGVVLSSQALSPAQQTPGGPGAAMGAGLLLDAGWAGQARRLDLARPPDLAEQTQGDDEVRDFACAAPTD